MPCISAVKIEAELRLRWEKVFLPAIEYARPTQLPMLDPTVKQSVALGKEFKVPKK